MSILTVKEESLTALGDAIRSKVGGDKLIFPTGMVEAIEGIKAGPTEEDLTFTGDISYLFNKGRFLDWQDRFPFTLKNISKAVNAFDSLPKEADISKIVINTINYSDVGDGAYISNIFNNNANLTALPTINGRISIFSQNLFNGCRCITDDEMRKFLFNPNLELAWSGSSNRVSNPGISSMFYYCVSLRNINDILLYIHQYFRDNPITYPSNLMDYYSMAFYNCDGLDEICNVPIITFPKHSGNTSNIFNNFCSYCGRVKNVMFATDNGTPYIRKWKNQMLELHTRVGYIASYQANLQGYLNGITADKEVVDDATYQALKNDPDWFTCKIEYSRYNHDSAVNTINSLPDTSAYLASAGGTNTIKFKGTAGSLTDGGAINTLTDAEIAVAAAKGWTVSFA